MQLVVHYGRAKLSVHGVGFDLKLVEDSNLCCMKDPPGRLIAEAICEGWKTVTLFDGIVELCPCRTPPRPQGQALRDHVYRLKPSNSVLAAATCLGEKRLLLPK